jgi:hypothetical protein
MKRTCKICNKEKRLTELHFVKFLDKYYTHQCRKCLSDLGKERHLYKKFFEAQQREKNMRINRVCLGHKDEAYYTDENYKYVPPTYEEILKEYENN